MSLFYFTLLTLAVFSTASLPLEKLLRNPKLFAAAFAHADPDIIEKMIGLVDRLLQEGKNDVAAAEADKIKTEAARNAAANEQSAASKLLSDISAQLVQAETLQETLTNLEKEHKQQLEAATAVKNSMDAKKRTADSHLTSTTDRVKNEGIALEDIIEKLKSVKPDASRRLLSDADPAAVDKVIAEIENLIAAGKAELAAAQDAAHLAAQAAIKAQEEFTDATAQHQLTSTKLDTATGKVDSLSDKKATALKEKNQADKKLADATSVAESADQWYNQEVSRVEAEEATLNEVRALLKKNE